MPRALRYFLVPLTMVAAFVAALSFGWLIPEYDADSPFYALAESAPVLLIALCGLLGWKLNQTRIFLFSVYLVGLYLLLGWRTSLPGLPGQVLAGVTLGQEIAAVSLALPLSFLLGWSYGESRLVSAASGLRLLLILLPAAGLLAFAGSAPEEFTRLSVWPDGASPAGDRHWRLPPGAAALSILPWFSWVMARDFVSRIFSGTFAISLVPFLFGLNALAGAAASPLPARAAFTLSWALGSVVLLYGMFRIFIERIYIDELTEIPNRRALNERLRRLGRRYSIAMLDIDHFKKFNDRFGHEEGDHVLRFVAQHLMKESGSKAYRYGGEEFCIVFPGLDADRAALIIDRARRRLQERAFHIRAPEPVRRSTGSSGRGRAGEVERKVGITVSSGVAERTREWSTPERVIKEADRALYAAKRGGRNNVVIA